jgi:tRNA(fMet)-specific endonuclease VapC
MGPFVSTKASYLLDTNHLALAVAPDSPLRRRLVERRRAGVRVGTCVPVLCELEAGIQQVREPQRYRDQLARLLRQVTVWPIDVGTARLYGEIHFDLRRRGRVLSQCDMMIAALARQMKLVILTTDADFSALPDLPQENWTLPKPDPKDVL